MSKRNLTKTQIAKKLEVHYDLDPKLAKEVADGVMDMMRDTLLQGNRVVLHNLGTLKPVFFKSRTKVAFGKTVQVGPKTKIKFIPSKNFDEQKNGAVAGAKKKGLREFQKQITGK